LVDDDPTLVQLGRRMLESLGYRVTTTTSSKEALGLFRAAPQGYDLVLTDQVMPELSGIELAQDLLRLRPELPIILCSGFGGTATSDQARAQGLRDYLGKPFSKGQLAQALQRALAG
jgi:CheY-like chemotaxis protein